MVVEQRQHYQIEMEADHFTAISLYHQLEGAQKVLFESSAKHEESGRYSFIAANPSAVFIAEQHQITLTKGTETTQQLVDNPFAYLKELLPLTSERLPFSFYGGAVGYIGYETAFYHEDIGELLEDPIHMPDMHLLFFDTFLVLDHLRQIVTIATIDLFNEGLSEAAMQQKVAVLEATLKKPILPQATNDIALNFQPAIDEAQYCAMVEAGKREIAAGNLFQIVLSQRFSAHYAGNPMHLYRQLRKANPSPYMYYIDFQTYVVLGTSPESLVKVTNRQVTTNPIAGTRPRGKTEDSDAQLAQQLLADEKELAEHRMLVDLGRNDLGKLCQIGSITMPKFMVIERYKYVMHIVSEVTGRLQEQIHPLDVVASCLPAGTVSGAPKIRAMQCINTLEQVKRGVYAGAIGYLSTTGDLDFALAIRTMVVKDGQAYVQAGAGIVHHSEPHKEYEETLNKARALLEVLQ